MTPSVPSPADVQREVLALIETLRDTERRLELLTGGEIDSVVTGDGRTFVLRRAQEQLRQRGVDRQGAILNALPAHIALLDLNGVIVSVNDAWRRFDCSNAVHGPGHPIGADYLERCDSAQGEQATDAHRLAEGIRSVLAGWEKRFSIEYACQATPDVRRWFLLTATPLADDRLLGVVIMNVDVTAERQTELDLRATESRFRQMAENIRDAFFLRDLGERRMLYISPAYEQIWGRSRAELYANPESWMSAIHPDDRGRAAATNEKALESGTFEFECRIVRPDGTIRWVKSRGYPVHDEIGEMVRIACVSEDITERKEAGRELLESERRFSDLLQNVDLASVMLDCDARITYCNDYLLRLTGWRLDEVIGRNWFEQFMPSEPGDRTGAFKSLLESVPKAWPRENEIQMRSGERRLMRWNNWVRQSANGTVVGSASIGEDITEQRRAEVRIKRLNRVYAVLSGINTLIVRVRDRDELFREACRIVVEHGRFLMAWIGLVDPDTGRMKPVASAGATGDFLSILEERYTREDDPAVQDSLMPRAVREKKTVFLNDAQNDPRSAFKEEHAKIGSRSVAVLPLQVADDVVGILALHSDELDFFDDEELTLLTELAGDIAFAIDHIEKEDKLDYLAYYDALTGLANRSLFVERVRQCINNASSGGHQLAVFLIDLERFKEINDGLGQVAGDALLRQVAAWLTHNAGDASLLARVSADHFAVVLPRVRPDGDLPGLVERMAGAFLEHPFRVNEAVFRIAAKVGVALFPDDGATADVVYKNAEAALKNAKASGDRYLFYTQSMTDRVAGRISLENQLRQALANDEFVLHYQPKLNLATGKLTSVEALIRWNDPQTGLVPPNQFIPILEATGLILAVGRWALHKAVEDHLRWRNAGFGTVRIAVNVSPLQLRNRGFVAEIEQALRVDDGAAAGLEIEITESLIMADVKHTIATIQAIRGMGVRIAIDDFGTGFSSLSYLSRLPVDTLKIDRSFVVDMTTGPEGLALVSTVIGLAHALKLNVVAEGVETDEQLRLLRLLSCDEMQGFVCSKPLPRALFETRFLAVPGRSQPNRDGDQKIPGNRAEA